MIFLIAKLKTTTWHTKNDKILGLFVSYKTQVVESSDWDLFEIVQNVEIPGGNMNAQVTCEGDGISGGGGSQVENPKGLSYNLLITSYM